MDPDVVPFLPSGGMAREKVSAGFGGFRHALGGLRDNSEAAIETTIENARVHGAPNDEGAF
jgi:hypothetical protein